MSEAFTSQPESVGSLLGPTRRERIVVPAFPRGYEWTDTNIDDFWRDLSRFRAKSKLKDGPDAPKPSDFRRHRSVWWGRSQLQKLICVPVWSVSVRSR